MSQSFALAFRQFTFLLLCALPLSSQAASTKEAPLDLSIIAQSDALRPYMTQQQRVDYIEAAQLIKQGESNIRSGENLHAQKPSTHLNPRQGFKAPPSARRAIGRRRTSESPLSPAANDPAIDRSAGSADHSIKRSQRRNIISNWSSKRIRPRSNKPQYKHSKTAVTLATPTSSTMAYALLQRSKTVKPNRKYTMPPTTPSSKQTAHNSALKCLSA